MSGDIPASIRAGVHTRDFSRCVACGAPGTDIHHRMRRREGGHSLANCILLCRTDHSRAHANPEWGRLKGLIIPTWVGAENVGEVPVRSWRGWLMHNQDGTVGFVKGTVEDALHYRVEKVSTLATGEEETP